MLLSKYCLTNSIGPMLMRLNSPLPWKSIQNWTYGFISRWTGSGIRKYSLCLNRMLPRSSCRNLKICGVICSSVEPVLFSELGDKGIHFLYWDVTNTWGHWNHAAQKVVSEHLYGMIKQNEE